jgi:hypothetical protein
MGSRSFLLNRLGILGPQCGLDRLEHLRRLGIGTLWHEEGAAGQKEMLLSIAGKKPAKETGAKEPAAKLRRKSA